MTLSNHLNQNNNSFIIFMQGLISFNHPSSKSFEPLALKSTKQLNNISRNFKRSSLKIHEPGREDEAEVDVDESTVHHVY